MDGRRVFKSVMASGVALAVLAAFVSPAASQSLSDRFKSLFGGKSDEPAQTTAPAAPQGLSENQVEDSCPQVAVRAGASTFSVAAPGKQATGNDVRFQATIGKTARDCRKDGDQIVARIGIQGRIVVGPAGAPESIEVPMRVAVVQGGVGEKVIATKAYRTTVAVGEGDSVPFSLVADDLVYPIPPGGDMSNYIFYIGFDPQALAPEPKAKAPRKKK